MTAKKTTAREKIRFADEMAESFGVLRQLGMIGDAAYQTTLRDLDREGGMYMIAPLSTGEMDSRHFVTE